MKNRIVSFVVAFTLIIGGLFIPGTESVYAASAKAISSAEDLLKMEENPSGSYYLAKDITVPKNTCLFATGTSFTGTLDGKGHKLKGYKSTEARAIFASAKKAAFKNLSVTNVDIKVTGSVAALVCEADNCSFNNVSVSGTIVSTGTADGYTADRGVGGIAAYGSGTMVKCKSSAKITAKGRKFSTGVGGLAGDFEAKSLKNCSNSGAITLSTGTQKYAFDSDGEDFYGDPKAVFAAAGLIGGISDKMSSCKNSGSVTLNLNYSVDLKKSESSICEEVISVYAGGICRESYGAITSSGNTGKVKVTSKSTAKVYGSVYVGGMAAKAAPKSYEAVGKVLLSKCYNTGAVSFSGLLYGADSIIDDKSFWIGGLFGKSAETNQCYNKGNVTVSFLSGHRGNCCIGGVSGDMETKITNCYNTGNVTVTNKGKKGNAVLQAGGIAGVVFDGYGDITCNYSTGNVKCAKNARSERRGLLFGYWYGRGAMSNKRYLYNNYYTRSGKAYGAGDTSWKKYQPTGNKVSSITSKKCPKLSSKYWTYSSKYKRLILKKNKEK